MNVSNTFATAIFVACLFVFGLAFALLLYKFLRFLLLRKRLIIAFLPGRNGHHVDMVLIEYRCGNKTEITPCSFHLHSLGHRHLIFGVIYIGTFDIRVSNLPFVVFLLFLVKMAVSLKDKFCLRQTGT